MLEIGKKRGTAKKKATTKWWPHHLFGFCIIENCTVVLNGKKFAHFLIVAAGQHVHTMGRSSPASWTNHGWNFRHGEASANLKGKDDNEQKKRHQPTSRLDNDEHERVKDYLEEYFDAVDEKENDDDEHENRIAPIENVGVEMQVFMPEPNENQFRDQKRVADDVEGGKAQEWLGQESGTVPTDFLQMEHFGPKADDERGSCEDDGVVSTHEAHWPTRPDSLQTIKN